MDHCVLRDISDPPLSSKNEALREWENARYQMGQRSYEKETETGWQRLISLIYINFVSKNQ